TQTELYKSTEMEIRINAGNGEDYFTTGCPIRINGKKMISDRPAPLLGQHTEKIKGEFLL
ncbi:MAG TPA: CoA transferase, partial [Niabella sp.]|nr:CoA transferase [Niabella sp.]